VEIIESDHHYDRTYSVLERPLEEWSRREYQTLACTQRQTDVLRELAKAQSNKQIGRALALSPETVNHHLKAIYLKLDVRTRDDAVVEARRRGIIV
jgi:DNA-binding CsgD family transcriptional regulator